MKQREQFNIYDTREETLKKILFTCHSAAHTRFYISTYYIALVEYNITLQELKASSVNNINEVPRGVILI